MAKNVQSTRIGRVGKRNALLAKPEIRMIKASGQKDLNSEIGNLPSQAMGRAKRITNSKLAGKIRGKA